MNTGSGSGRFETITFPAAKPGGAGGRLRLGLIGALAALLLALVVTGVAPPQDSSAAIPSNFRRHQELYWVWYGPESWGASSGKYDLNISSPTGTLWNKYGAGGVVCPASAGQWFKSLRDNYQSTAGQGFGLYSKPLKSARFTKIGGIRKLDTYYFRQTVKWLGRRRNGARIKGEMVMDVFVVDLFSGVCGQRFQVRGAPARGYGKSIRLLRTIQSTVTSQNL